MDAFFIALLGLLWLSTVVLAYGTGWVKGHEISEENHRWDRWLIRNAINRSRRL